MHFSIIESSLTKELNIFKYFNTISIYCPVIFVILKELIIFTMSARKEGILPFW